MIKKYKAKPVVVEAMTVKDRSKMLTLFEFLGGIDLIEEFEIKFDAVSIKLLDRADLSFRFGDYIIKSAHGEFYSVKKEIFESKYTPIVVGEEVE